MLIKRNCTRRRFLQGFGGSLLALPLLEANSASGTFASPKRITATGIFYGFVPQNFHPQQTGRNFQSPLLLKPLESHRNDYSVFSGLDHNLSGGHNATKFFLSGIPTNQSKGFAEANISIDQKAANFVGRANSLFLAFPRFGPRKRTYTFMDQERKQRPTDSQS